MSPLEIPGTVLKFLNRKGKRQCSRCRQNYNVAQIKLKGGFIIKSCPNCNHEFARYNHKDVAGLSARRRK